MSREKVSIELTAKQFMITVEQHQWLEDQAISNKRLGNRDLDSISKVVRAAIEEYQSKKGEESK